MIADYAHAAGRPALLGEGSDASAAFNGKVHEKIGLSDSEDRRAAWSRSASVEPSLLLQGLARQESMFRERCGKSPAGARGLMQLIPSTARIVAKRKPDAPYDPDRLDG